MAETQQNGMATTAPQANTALTPFQQSQGGATAFQFMNGEGFNSAGQPVTASTTTISNTNKINQVPGIINTTNQLSDTGIRTDVNGNQIYANGVMVPQQEELPPAPTSDLSKSGISQGGYIGDVYYAPGAPLPTGQDGKPVPTTATSPTDDAILENINSLKANSDALTASLIDSIHQQFASLRSQQERANAAQEASVRTSLLMGGVTGTGSSSQFAPISSAGIISAQINYGLGQIADLNAKEQSALIQAKQAGMERNFKLMDSLNNQISKIRDEKVAAAVKLNDTILAQNERMREEQKQITKENAVADLYKQGVTDIGTIQKELKKNGLNMSASEISNTLQAIGPTVEEQKVAAQNVADAQAQGVNTRFANKVGAFFDTLTGKVFPDPESFFRAAGVSSFEEAYQKGLVTDIQNTNLDFATTEIDGRMVRIGFDALGNVVSRTDIGPAKIDPNDTTKDADPTQEVIDSVGSQLQAITGKAKGDPNGDNYIDPVDFNAALQQWVDAGYSVSSFHKNYDKFINPERNQDYDNYPKGSGVSSAPDTEDAKTIANAIKQVESGGDYNAKGGSGESGAYQFMPSTWKDWAKKYLGSANAPMTKENQDKVAIAKITDLLNQGYGAKEIALIWNGGQPVVKKGTNKYGVKYDSGAYANKVLKALG